MSMSSLWAILAALETEDPLSGVVYHTPVHIDWINCGGGGMARYNFGGGLGFEVRDQYIRIMVQPQVTFDPGSVELAFNGSIEQLQRYAPPAPRPTPVLWADWVDYRLRVGGYRPPYTAEERGNAPLCKVCPHQLLCVTRNDQGLKFDVLAWKEAVKNYGKDPGG